VTVQSQLCGASDFCDLPLTFWQVKNQSCQVIRVQPVHRLNKMFQLSSAVN